MLHRHFRTYLLLTLMIMVSTINADYYDSVINLTGQNLFYGLRSLISNNTNTSYDDSKEVLFQTLDNTGGNVTCIYTGQVYNVGYNYNGSNNPNTEHTYAQSWFNGSDTSKKKSDLHHLFVTNSVVNSSRGNLPLYTVGSHSAATVYYTNTPWQSYRGYSLNNQMVFEPADESKGNIARALLYFYTRYNNESLVQQNTDMLPVLVQWHSFDPPDAAEITRNTGVYNYQNNRNPYVDHPEFVGRIWGGSSSEDELLTAVSDIFISSCYPNPFSSELNYSISSKSDTPATLTIYNLKGQAVHRQELILQPGESKFRWDGKDASGSESAAGIYLIRVSGKAGSTTIKTVKI